MKSIFQIFSLILSLSLIPFTSISANCEESVPMEEPFDYNKALQKLEPLGEARLLNYWTVCTDEERKQLLNDIQALDSDLLVEQKKALEKFFETKKEPEIIQPPELNAFMDFSLAGSESNKALGKKLIAEGKVACLIVAGGQGTRLSHQGPKGTYRVSRVKKKSLFQIFAEKTLAAGKQVGQLLPLAIMTSPQNDAETRAFFSEHNYFGLAEEQVSFYVQGELPFLDDEKHLIKVSSGARISKGPDGNGDSLSRLVTSGIWDAWHQQGIEYVNFVIIDNPLADPFDAELVGFHVANKCEITNKCVERFDEEERVGLVVNTDSGPEVIEYSEMPKAERQARLPNGKLKHRCTNISLFCFSMDFIKNTVNTKLPWHLAYKPTGTFYMGWKFETFIFDHMKTAQAVKALLYPRAQCFAPLKNRDGADSLKTVREALLKHDFEVLESICGHSIDRKKPIELDQQFYYPTPELLEHWKDRKGPFKGYIDSTQ